MAMTAKEVNRALRMLQRVPMTEAEKQHAAERRARIAKYRQRVFKRILRKATQA